MQDNVPLTIKLDESEVVTEVVSSPAEAAELVDAEFSSEAHDLAQSKKVEAEAKAKMTEEPQLGSVSGDDWSQPIANR